MLPANSWNAQQPTEKKSILGIEDLVAPPSTRMRDGDLTTLLEPQSPSLYKPQVICRGFQLWKGVIYASGQHLQQAKWFHLLL